MIDTYVIIGYNGKISKDKRGVEDAITEAYNMIQVAHEMIDVVREERNRLKDPLLKDLDLKIGMNTGKIVAGIIGTKVVRYDIFGQGVLVSNLVMHKATPGIVTVSEQMRRLISRKPFIFDTFDWQEAGQLQVPGTEIKVRMFTVEQIFAELDSISEDNEI